MRRRQAPVRVDGTAAPGGFVLAEWLPFVPPEPDGWPFRGWAEQQARRLWFAAVRRYADAAGLNAYAVAYPGRPWARRHP